MIRDYKPIATAVSSESPVSIFSDAPVLVSVWTASLTPSLGGSIMPTIPRNTSCDISDPSAIANTVNSNINTYFRNY